MRRLAYYAVVGVLVLAVLVGLSMGFSTLKAPVTAIQQAREAWVDDDDPTCGGNSPCFRTIQAAIDAIQLGPYQSGTVHIRPGLYREHVVLIKNVELEGAGRELVRLEAPDPTKPAILVKGTYLSELSGLGIFGGSVGILVEDAQVFAIEYNRIAGYTEAGIRLIRSKTASDMSIFFNELPDPENSRSDPDMRGIQVLEGSSASIFRNTIRSPLEIRGQGSTAVIEENLLASVHVLEKGRASIARNQLTSPIIGGASILVGMDAEAKIITNQIQSYPIGILVRGRAHIINNLIFQNGVGILVGSPYLSKDSLDQSPPQLRIIRNQIKANTSWGLALFWGRGIDSPRAEVRNNVISENGVGDSSSFPDEAGVVFGPQVRLDFSNNWVMNNWIGICPYFDDRDNPIDPEALTGKDNIIQDNERDICSWGTSYPWPPGFRK